MYNDKADGVKIVLDMIKEKIKATANLTDFEKDIFDTADEFSKMPFDRNAANNRKNFNYIKYHEISAMVMSIPGIRKISGPLTDEQIKENLYYQLSCFAELYLAGKR